MGRKAKLKRRRREVGDRPEQPTNAQHQCGDPVHFREDMRDRGAQFDRPAVAPSLPGDDIDLRVP